MVKTPSVRHSKSRKDPVTIDLEASPLAPEPSKDGHTAAGETVPDDLSRETAAAATPADRPEKIVEGKGFVMSAPDQPADQSAGRIAKRKESGSAEQAPPADPHKALSITDNPAADTGSPSAQAKPSPQQEKPASEPPKAAATPNPPSAQPRRGGMSAIAAGLIGGVIALAGASALQYAGMLPSPVAGSSVPGDAAALESLRSEMAGMQAELASLKSAAGASSDGQAVADLQGRLATLTDEFGTLKTAVESGGGGENAGLAALDAKIADLQAQLSKIAEAPQATVDLGPLNEKITSLEAAIGTATESAGAADARLATVEETVAALTGKVEAQADQPKIALSIAASALKSAIDRGQPFAAELETLAAISPDVPQLAGLRAHAETGVATRDQLIADMDAAANAMIASGTPDNPDAGYLDKLLESASSLVTVRPVGVVEGEGVPETVARMEAALKAGDLAKALAEYDALPDAAKTAGSAFADKLRAHLDTERLVDEAIAEAMKTV